MSNFKDNNFNVEAYCLGEKVILTDKPIVLHDVIIGRFGLVMTSNFEKIEGQANHTFDMWMPLRTRTWSPFKHVPADLLCGRNNQTISLPDGVYISIVEFGERTTYGHFWDHAQGLLFLDDHKHGIVLHSPSFVTNLQDHLKILGFDHSLSIDTQKYNYRVPTLIIPPAVQPPNVLHVSLINELRERYWRFVVGDIAPQKIYMARPNGITPISCTCRHAITNQQEICDTLLACGFTIFTGYESLEDTIRMFRSAVLIAGYHGSAMKNMIFCRPEQTKFVYWYSEDDVHDSAFTSLSDTCNIERINVFTHAVPPRQETTIEHDVINQLISIEV